MTTPQHSRHSGGTDEIYRTMMAERTGEDPENYRNRAFDADLLDYAPSAPRLRVRTSAQFPPPAMPPQEFGPWPPAGTGGTTLDPFRSHLGERPSYRAVRDQPQA